ncbi:MAG: hypothetical protein KAH95_11715 [Spirochaetales bacterium]|nr:hypothetical protein [Spirochaetales bacterium]
MIKKTIFSIFLIFIVFFAFSEELGDISFSITPGGMLPLGDSASYFTTGGGADLSVDFRLNALPLFFFRLDTAYSYIPIRTKDGVSVYSALAGGGISLHPMEKLNLAAYGTGGYFYSSVKDGSGSGGGNLSLKGGLSVSYDLSPTFSLLGDFSYLYNFYLYQGIRCISGCFLFYSPKQERKDNKYSAYKAGTSGRVNNKENRKGAGDKLN